jgi:hypothetical protein
LFLGFVTAFVGITPRVWLIWQQLKWI